MVKIRGKGHDLRVGFALKVKYFMVFRRTMLTTVTLAAALALMASWPKVRTTGEDTHNNPTLNIDRMLNFFSADSFNFQIVGNGSSRTAISANMFRLEFAQPCALMLEQLP